jgi:hypothetical protein
MRNLASKKGPRRSADHLNGVQVVGGSNPPIPTNWSNNIISLFTVSFNRRDEFLGRNNNSLTNKYLLC